MFGLSRQAGGRTTALNIANHEGNFDGDGEPQGFGLEGHAGARSGSNGQGAGVCGSNRGGDGGDFVFSLESDDAEILVLRELVQNVGRRSDGIAALKKFQAGFLRSGNEAERQGLVAAHAAVKSRFEMRRGNFIADLERFGGFAVGVAGFHGQLVGFDQERFLGKFVFDPVGGGLHGAVVQPVAHAKCEEIFATANGLGVQAEMIEGHFGEALQFDGEEAELVERMVFEGIGSHLRFAKIGFRESVGIDDKDAVGLEVGEIHFEGGGVHGDENVNGIAGGIDFVGRKMQLVTADAGERARRSANFSGEIRERSDVVAVKRDGIGELAAGDLHAVAGISGEADHRAVNDLAFVLRQRNVCGRGHAW